MKKILLIISFCILLFSCASKSVSENTVTESIPEDPMEKFYRIKDDFAEIKFTHFNNPESYPFSIYMGENKDSKWLRMTFSYIGKEWLFFKTAQMKNSNGDFLLYDIPKFDKKEKVFYGGVSEFIDMPLGYEDAVTLKNFLSAGGITLRLSGDHYHKDSEINKETVDAYCELIELVYPE